MGPRRLTQCCADDIAPPSGSEMTPRRPNDGRTPRRARETLDEVAWSGWGGTGSRPSVRASRAEGISDREWEAVHLPTGVFVRGALVRGYYTRAQLSRLGRLLWAAMTKRLALEVAVATRQGRRSGGRVSPLVPANCTVTTGRYTVSQLMKRGLRK
jgi:hypothetical protein